MRPSKGKVVHVYVSVPPSQYLTPNGVHPCRIKSRRLGRIFKSGVRKIKFDGVQAAVTVITIRETLM